MSTDAPFPDHATPGSTWPAPPAASATPEWSVPPPFAEPTPTPAGAFPPDPPPPAPPGAPAPAVRTLIDDDTADEPEALSLSAAPYDGPRLTASALVDALVSSGVIDAGSLDALMGAERFNPTVNGLDNLLDRAHVLSTQRLLALKSSVAGLPVPDVEVKALPVLPPAVAKAAGALVLDVDQPVVGFVEDLPLNVERVRYALGRDDFAVWLITAPLFGDLFRATYPDVAGPPPLDRRPLPADLLVLFDEAITRDASDLHLSAAQPPVVRVGGNLVRLPYGPLPDEWLREQFTRLLGERVATAVRERFDADAAYSYGPVRFRINLGADTNGLTAAIRRLPATIPTFDELGLPASVREFCNLERGLVLVTGPTGSGKSTTLASMLSHIGMHQSRHILTLEDPIEFVIPHRAAVVHQRELGMSFSDFYSGLRQSLRQDPDVILVGEARDRETISAAVTAAETGALVFATLHTYDAVSSLARMVGVFPEGEQDQIRSQMAYVLKGVVSQTLVPTLSGGRQAAFEVLVSTPAVANNLRKVDGLTQLRQVLVTGARAGMQTMEANLAQLVRDGVVATHDAEFKARDVDEFRRYLNQTPE